MARRGERFRRRDAPSDPEALPLGVPLGVISYRAPDPVDPETLAARAIFVDDDLESWETDAVAAAGGP